MIHRRPSRHLIGVFTIALALATTGCHVEQPQPPTPSAAATPTADELQSLPSLEETASQVRAVMTEITDAASKLDPTITWLPLHGDERGNCEAPYQSGDGKRLFLPDQVAEGAHVSEAHWVMILAAATTAAAKIGATDVQVMKDQSGNHDVWFTGPAGISVKTAYHGNLVVSGYTGCRLPSDKK